MSKQYALKFWCGLPLGLAACAPPATEPTPVEASQAEQVKPDSPDARARENRPRRNADGGRPSPPEIAYAACPDLVVEAACSFETLRGTRTGVCQTREGESRAVCFVQHPEALGEARQARDRQVTDQKAKDREEKDPAVSVSAGKDRTALDQEEYKSPVLDYAVVKLMSFCR